MSSMIVERSGVLVQTTGVQRYNNVYGVGRSGLDTRNGRKIQMNDWFLKGQ